jgi:hypothetical protein
MSKLKERLATEVDADVLLSIRTLAEREGQQIDELVDEALADLLEKRKNSRPRSNVMEQYLASHDTYGSLYKKLAE